MTAKVDTFSTLVDSFSSSTQSAETTNFSHAVSFRGSKVIKAGSSLVRETEYSGASIKKAKDSIVVVSGDEYVEYTNYEKTEIKSSPKNESGDVLSYKVTYAIGSIGSDPTSTQFVSYDDFEKIDPNYDPDDMVLSIDIGNNYAVEVHFTKPPNAAKVKSPELFNSTIKSDTSFWSYRAASVLESCHAELLSTADRIIHLKLVENAVSSPINSGGFSSPKFTSLGRDGRFAKYSDIVGYAANAKVELTADSNGYVFNEVKYPLKSDNIVSNISAISSANNLYVSFLLEFNKSSNRGALTINVFDELGTISISSGSIVVPYSEIDDVYSKFSLQSKVAASDITLASISQEVTDTPEPDQLTRYQAPHIYLTSQIGSGSELGLTVNNGRVSMAMNQKLIMRSFASKSYLDSKIYMSIDGGAYFHGTASILELAAKYGTHTIRAYVEGDSTISRSEVSELTFVVDAIVPEPVFTVDSNLLVSATSDFDIVYSTDGSAPDIKNRSNVAVYADPFTIYKKTIIKAYAVHGEIFSSLALFVFDPESILTSTSTLPTVSIAGAKVGDEYSEVATATISTTGIGYYTVDGSDPKDSENPNRLVYVSPVKIMPVGSKHVTLRVAARETGKKIIEVAPTTIDFAFECNPWVVSESTLDHASAVVTSNGELQLNSGAAVTRKKALTGDFYYSMNVEDVVGNSSLVAGFEAYLSTFNNLSEGEYTGKWEIPSLTFLDRVGDIVTCALGYRKGILDKERFKAVSMFDWNISKPLPVTFFVKDEVRVPDNVLLFDAESMNSRITDLDSYLGVETYRNLNYLRGAKLTQYNSVVVSDIPANEKRLLVLPALPEDADARVWMVVCNKGTGHDAELIVSDGGGTIIRTDLHDAQKLSISIPANGAMAFFNGADSGWCAIAVSDFTSYTSSKMIKMSVNGVETEYRTASEYELDYLMLRVLEVNSEHEANVKIGSIKGGCL